MQRAFLRIDTDESGWVDLGELLSHFWEEFKFDLTEDEVRSERTERRER